MLAQALHRVDTSRASRVIGVLAFALLTGLCSRVAVLVPNSPVPLTLQVLTVVLSGYVLGGQHALIAQLLYLQAILLGAPLTATGLAGPAALLSPTAGYLISFPAAAFAAGWISQHWRGHTSLARALGGVAALVVIYSLGTLWLSGFVGGLGHAFALGVAPFLAADIFKIAIAVALLSLRRQ